MGIVGLFAYKRGIVRLVQSEEFPQSLPKFFVALACDIRLVQCLLRRVLAACTHRQCLFMRGFEPFVAGLQIFGQQPEIAAVQVLAVGDGVEVGLSFGCLFDRGAYCAVHFVYQVPGKVHSR